MPYASLLERRRLDLARGEQPPLPDMAPGEYVSLALRDSGKGIPGDVLPHVFEPFFTTKSRGKGTGLGLAQVYGIVRQHEGAIDVQSEAGQGATFTLYLPVATAGAGADAETGPLPSHVVGGGETILLVEDDFHTRAAIQETLSDLGYRVLEAGNGQEALALLQEQEAVDLVLSDMVMPEMGGVELHRHLQAEQPGPRILFISGYPLHGEGNGLLQQGGVAWIQKPFAGDELAQKIRQMLDGSP